DKAYNDSAIWVDFTKDDKPRHFRLGVFGALQSWNPQNLPPDKNPAFLQRLVVVKQPPFDRGKWTHVGIVFADLGKGGNAKLFVNGKLQGATPAIPEPFQWDVARAAIRLGVNYVGLLDDVAIFRRPLTDQEIGTIASQRF
ncbi:MAG TPA: LamG-like jellyroll fold domain-containing protein, partial [Bryobacterales bacterium]|nr:LamG-like jellyroll fold domain-containing protein [Bryobacterales bacterium]